MSRSEVLAKGVDSVEDRLRQIAEEPLHPNLAALLADAAEAAPDKMAWNFFESGETITYAELHRKVRALARGMLRAGIGKGVHVGVMLPNVAAFPLTWLALGTLGAVMIPINIAYMERELRYVLENGDVTWLVIDSSCVDALPQPLDLPECISAQRIFVVGNDRPPMRRWDDLFEPGDDPVGPQADVSLDDPLNIQYTSGTTGFPKGCILPHRYWLTIGKVSARRDGRHFERILAATPFFYMDPQWLLLMSFHHRATLFVAKRQSASRFMSWVREHRIQFCLFPEIMFKQPPSPFDRQNEIIRVNVYGLNKEIHAAVEERFDFVAREVFGMTEAGTCMFMPIEATDMIGSGSCGKPAPFREARIADENGCELASGEIGELQLRGPGMFQGYYKNAEATAAVFADGWFRTGDLFRRDERGYFYIVGRMKDMIRRSGENVAAREVEAVLRQLPQVEEAAAVPVPDPVRGEEIKVYVVLRAGFDPSNVPPNVIVSHCEVNLARFKVPRYIAYHHQLPKTPTGKIAKKLLLQEAADLRVGAFDRVEGCWR